ncbi:MAG TPA: SLBB domain-containing protein [Burkholderiaceae bacterium]|nr:SLBB domain-containing protein [Burkholderiaceae bacterium]
MPKIRLRRSLRSSFLRRLLAGALCVALAPLTLPAAAQFTGDSGLDLQSTGTTSNSSDTATDTSSSDNTMTGNDDSGLSDTSSGVTRVTSPASNRNTGTSRRSDQPEVRDTRRQPPYVPSEFERYVQSRVDRVAASTDPDDTETVTTVGPDGQLLERTRPVVHKPVRIRRFGADLMTDPQYVSAAQDPLPAVPDDYVLKPGDEIRLTLWGSIDGNLRLVVDRTGRISVPRVGAIVVAGLHNAELHDAIARRVGSVYRNFDVAATVGQVRAVRVFVSGYALRPGSVTINGLASVLHAIMRAGGPSAAGSYRDIHLRRGGKEIAVFDLYDLLLKGNRDTDQLVQPDDVIFIGPAGPQVAVLGSVNQQAIFELKPGEDTLADVLRMAGNFNAVADRSRVAVERLADRTTGRIAELALPQHEHDVLATGDIVRAFSAVVATLPTGQQNKRVRVEGEVLHPGDYVLPPGSRISDALRLAGGLTTAAFPYGTEFSRESVRETQQVNYDRALRDLETDMAKNQSSQRATSAEEINAQSASASANARLLERLRQVRPTGRVVLEISPEAATLPDFDLEDGDTLNIPPRGTSVGVFGSVFTTGSFVYSPNRTAGNYVDLAGGPTRGADAGSMFVIHANGAVASALQGSSFWHSGTESFRNTRIVAGDTIYVPEEINQATFIQDAKDWTQILYQFGLGLAGVKALGL